MGWSLIDVSVKSAIGLGRMIKGIGCEKKLPLILYIYMILLYT